MAPIEREAEALGQKLGRELRWLSPFGDGFHDLGCQKSQPDDLADEAVVEAFASGDCSY